MAILLGTASAGVLLTFFGDQPWLIGVLLIVSAGVGFLSSLGIERRESADPDRSLRQWPFKSLGKALAYILKDRFLFLSMLGFSYVWFAGSVLMINLNVYGLQVMGLNETWTSLMIVVLAGGLGAGCLLAGRWSHNRVEPGLVPLGALGMGTCLLVFIQNPGGVWLTGAWLFMAGLFGGLFLIPLQTTLQERPAPEKKGSVLGTTNVFSFTAVLLSAAGYVVAVDGMGLGAEGIMGVLGGMTLVAGLGIVFIVPRFFVRFVLWLLVHTIYRIDVRGEENIPREGPALIVANHISYVDGLLIGACVDRFVRFLAYAPLFDIPFLGSFLRMMKMIPVDPGSPKQVKRALKEARDHLREGELVCIFAEGQITRTGQLLGLRRGVEKIGAGEDVPVIPLKLDEVWGSIFSFERGEFFWKVPLRLPYPVTISFGEPLRGEISRTKIRETIQALGADAGEERVEKQDPLPTKFARTARRYFWREASVDSLGTGPVRYGTLLVMSLAMARRLGKVIPADEKRVGVILPPSVPGAVVNLALAFLGKISVNLNYTAGDAVIGDCAQQADLKHVITSERFLEKAEVEPPAEPIYVEDLRDRVGFMDRVVGFGLALLPAPLITKWFSTIDPINDVVTVIFSSGSTGEPKGVELTHGNILANIQSLQQVASFDGDDRMMAILPFFHSFGYTGGLWMPFILGIGTCYHFNPMDARTVGSMMDEYEGTILIGTPTFLRLYARRCDAEQFENLRFPVCGAEKLKKSLAETFHEKFGIWPLEGYGCTEMAPVISVNIPNVEIDGTLVQKGRKLGSVGRPLPGVAVRVVDPDTGEGLEDGEEGLILVRGANRMKGYLNRPDRTAESFRGKWYVTGDIGKIDGDGFLYITDRLARFSKIGGEMVPHVKIEDQLGLIANEMGENEVEFVVTGVSDEKRGERLVVLYTDTSVGAGEWVERLRDRDLPSLWIPDESAFYVIDEIPTLGTGKLDLQAVKETARERAIDASS